MTYMAAGRFPLRDPLFAPTVRYFRTCAVVYYVACLLLLLLLCHHLQPLLFHGEESVPFCPFVHGLCAGLSTQAAAPREQHGDLKRGPEERDKPASSSSSSSPLLLFLHLLPCCQAPGGIMQQLHLWRALLLFTALWQPGSPDKYGKKRRRRREEERGGW